MKDNCRSLSWIVMYFDINAQEIKPYDILKYREEYIKKLKKKCNNKEEFAERIKREMMRSYWSKCEWELVVEIDENERVWLIPWVGSRDPDAVKTDVTELPDFDWREFAEYHISRQRSKGGAKIDVYDQLTYKDQFVKFVDYCWYTRLKYERYNPKFDK